MVYSNGTSSYAHVFGVTSGDEDQFYSSKSIAHQFIKPNVIDGCTKVSPPLEVTEEGSMAWRNTLVGYFYNTPGFPKHYSRLNRNITETK